ncbi:MAG: single-stranded-DNA-specific exonuclease RecJ [Phycisphaeraceae bacterium]|nr:MAG: single-stranded-DNA-specific exonuclease RecJ [Phycisphaeraceae bacterium]
MQGLTHRWIEPARENGGTGGRDRLSDDPLIDRILRARGVADAEAARRFCEPRLIHLHDPSGIPDLDRAAERILKALRASEPVVIYGDYDVDGVTASAILLHMCAAIAPGAPVSIYIPHRLEEGYGLSSEALEQLASQGASVVVSVDCGVGAVEPARRARELGLDLIITDHHTPPTSLDDLPDAHSVVHPRRPDSTYPFGELCGAGVAFKLAWRLATLATGSERVSPEMRELLLDLLALSALGAVADVVPLVDENRVMTRFGLARLKSTRFIGLNALIEAAGLAGDDINAEHVGFVLAPRLNACGRMGHAREAAELLTDVTPERADVIARQLTVQNDKRRAVERTIFEQACIMAEDAGMTMDDRRAIVLAHEEWHPGVVGIVCSRLVQRFGRPAILMQRAEGICQGSCRSVDGVSVCEGLGVCTDLLESHGGHDMAAGLRMRAERLDAFVERFTTFVNERLLVADLKPSLRIDCDATLHELTPETIRRIEGLGPYGRGNPTPRIRVRGLRVTHPPEPLGAGGRHMSMHVAGGGRTVRVLGWSWGERRSAIPAGASVDVVVKPKLNSWRGRVSVEPELCDLSLV